MNDRVQAGLVVAALVLLGLLVVVQAAHLIF